MHMRKRIIIPIVLAAIIIIIAVYIFPQSLVRHIDSADSVGIVNSEFSVDPTGIESVSYVIPAKSDAFEELVKAVSEYKYHRCIKTLFGNQVLENLGSYVLNIYVYDGSELTDSIAIGSDGYITIDARIYRVDYFGSSKQKELMERVKEVIDGHPEYIQE